VNFSAFRAFSLAYYRKLTVHVFSVKFQKFALILCMLRWLPRVIVKHPLYRVRVRKGNVVNREIKIDVSQHLPRTANLKKSRDQCVGVRLAV